MIPRDHAEELQQFTSLLTADGWQQIDLPLDGPEATRILQGISFRLISSPDQQILLTANWRSTSASTSIVRLNPADPRAALWHAEAVNMPVSILTAAARAAHAQTPGPGPIARLKSAGWQRQPAVTTGHGIRALIFRDPATEGRWAAAQYIPHPRRLERGPWMISRDDLTATDGHRVYAHTDAGAPGSVIAALTLTEPEPTR